MEVYVKGTAFKPIQFFPWVQNKVLCESSNNTFWVSGLSDVSEYMLKYRLRIHGTANLVLDFQIYDTPLFDPSWKLTHHISFFLIYTSLVFSNLMYLTPCRTSHPECLGERNISRGPAVILSGSLSVKYRTMRMRMKLDPCPNINPLLLPWSYTWFVIVQLVEYTTSQIQQISNNENYTRPPVQYKSVEVYEQEHQKCEHQRQHTQHQRHVVHLFL